MDAISSAREWIANDPDPADQAALQGLVDRAEAGDQQAIDELDDAMGAPLTFGTAGLRGVVGAGRNRMNTAVVTTATAGLCKVLAEDLGGKFHVVIGYDARHRSDSFARTVAGVVAAAGGRASLLPAPLPTPVLAFAVGHLDADAGVMVTASHNPPADNGYKVYLGERVAPDGVGGAQLVEPTDKRIQAAIEAVGPAAGVPVALPEPGTQTWATPAPDQAIGQVEVLGAEIEDAYCDAADRLRTRLEALTHLPGEMEELKVVLTAMHGVGAQVATRVLREAGIEALHLVEAQCAPDPDFPTVAFPNPEEPGAIDLAVDLARKVGADLVIALDPDADRCSLAVPDASTETGWRQLTGDQYGVLLGDYVGRAYAGDPESVLARSLVSGSLLDRIAERHGLTATQTLTGFKWIARAPGIVYGYEEAIGYCVNPLVVRDKDGITAALVACRLAAAARHEGKTLLDLLDDLEEDFGVHLTAPLTFRVADLSLISAGLERLSANPPLQLGGSQVIEFFDLAAGYAKLPPTTGYRLETVGGDRVVVRPSGTEPKLKCYLEVKEPVAGRDGLATARDAAAARMELIKHELTEILGF